MASIRLRNKPKIIIPSVWREMQVEMNSSDVGLFYEFLENELSKVEKDISKRESKLRKAML